MCPGAPTGELSTACKGLEMTVPSRVWFTHPHLLLPAQHLAFLCSRGAWAPEHWGFDWGQGTSPQTEEKSPQYLQSRILSAHGVQLVPKALTCSFLPGEFSPRNSHYAGVGGSLPWHHTPLAVQEKVAAAVPNTAQHHSQHPSSPLQEFTEDGKQLHGQTPQAALQRELQDALSACSALAASWAACAASLHSTHS